MEDYKDNLYNKADGNLDAFEFYYSEAMSTRVRFESDIFKGIERGEEKGLGLRVMVGGRLGFSSTTDCGDSEVIKRSKESAQFGEKALFKFAIKTKTPIYSLFDYKTQHYPVEGMIRLGEEIIDSIKGYNNQIKTDVIIEKESSYREIKTSEGFYRGYTKTLFSIYISSLLVKGNEFLNISKTSIKLSPIDEVKGLSEFIKNRYKLSEKQSKVKTGYYKVLFTPRALKTLITILLSSVNGKILYKGISPLAGKLGEVVLSKKLTILDDGVLEGGISSAPFDGEGILTRRKILFDGGILRGFIFDMNTGSLLKEESTGSGIRGYGVVPAPGFSNIVVEGGDRSLEDLFKDMGEGILVDQFIGAGQSNVLAGEFSVNMELAYKVEGGEVVGLLKDSMLSGNVYDVLKEKVLGVGNKLYQEGSGYYPHMLLDKLAISSKQ